MKGKEDSEAGEGCEEEEGGGGGERDGKDKENCEGKMLWRSKGCENGLD
jgi:hypothetical protein